MTSVMKRSCYTTLQITSHKYKWEIGDGDGDGQTEKWGCDIHA